jgi:hypothetical protein
VLVAKKKLFLTTSYSGGTALLFSALFFSALFFSALFFSAFI